MTDIPDDVRDYLERTVGEGYRNEGARQLLAKYPRSQPEPAWRVGDHYGIHVYAGDVPVATFHTAADAAVAVAAVNDRRVHPPRFADHAKVLFEVARRLRVRDAPYDADRLVAIAADLVGDNDV
jgi:hypothetical protein